MNDNIKILAKLDLLEEQAAQFIKSVTELKKSLTGKPGKTGSGKEIMKTVMVRREKAVGRRKY